MKYGNSNKEKRTQNSLVCWAICRHKTMCCGQDPSSLHQSSSTNKNLFTYDEKTQYQQVVQIWRDEEELTVKLLNNWVCGAMPRKEVLKHILGNSLLHICFVQFCYKNGKVSGRKVCKVLANKGKGFIFNIHAVEQSWKVAFDFDFAFLKLQPWTKLLKHCMWLSLVFYLFLSLWSLPTYPHSVATNQPTNRLLRTSNDQNSTCAGSRGIGG